MSKVALDENAIKAIETVLAKGDRAEVIPVKDGVKVMRVKREVVSSTNKKDSQIL